MAKECVMTLVKFTKTVTLVVTVFDLDCHLLNQMSRQYFAGTEVEVESWDYDDEEGFIILRTAVKDKDGKVVNGCYEALNMVSFLDIEGIIEE